MSVRVRVVQLHLLLVAIEEVEPKVRGRRHEGRLVRGGRGEAPLVAWLGLGLGLGLGSGLGLGAGLGLGVGVGVG